MERQQIIDGLKAKLDQWNAKIAKMEADLEKAKVENRAAAKEEIDRMKEMRQDAEDVLQKMRESGEENWEETRRKGEAAFNEIADGFARAWDRVA